MTLSDLKARGLVILGCGKMGSAMLAGWLDGALQPDEVWVIDPNPSQWLRDTGVHLNVDLPPAPALVLVAVKPQMMAEALPDIAKLGGGQTVFLSVAAGVALARYQAMLGAGTPIIRAMPNTPAAVGRGITALVANPEGAASLDVAEMLCRSIGEVVRLDDEAQMDAVTGVSGSGPAYVFHLIECLAAAGEAQGLGADLALQLAKATVAGAGHLAITSDKAPGQLRVDVTSPNGTTQAGLAVLMEGMPSLIDRTVAAATDRSKELAE